MQKQAPSIGRILVAVGFALSCFALLLFLWVTFGGPVPFKPASYRFSADFPEAITLQKEADVRVGGVTVGKVKSLELPPEGDATRAVIEIEPQYAPISSDAEAILRQKTLLGETYVELTTGTQSPEQEGASAGTATAQSGAIDVGEISGDDAPHAIPEGGHLESTQVADQTQIDEIFNGFDEQTRQAFQLWMKNSGLAIEGRGLDLNDAFGNIGPFSRDASDVLGTLRQQEQALRSLVRNTGTVFEALTARDQALAGAIVGTNRTFRALASRDQELAETFSIFPTFNREGRLTLDRLESFARNAGPLFRDLRPVARDISPTIRDLRRLSPHARRLFNNLDPLIKASATGLPALRSFLDELRPVMVNLDPFLANFNPIVRYLDYYAPVVTDFLANPAAGTAGALPPIASQTEPRHLSRQLSNLTEPNAESLSVWNSRIRTNRGNGYLMPFSLANPNVADQGAVFPNFDCENTQATGGLNPGQPGPPNDTPPAGPEMVTPEPVPPPAGGGGPASTPPTQEGVYPFSSSVLPALGGATGLFSNLPIFGSLPVPLQDALEALPTAPTFEQTAFATCVTQTWALGNFPAAFGGSRLPQVLADP
jgi:phospholipid/cholesterol/gamma-HCH transport system substrate-binding protein